MFPIQRGLCTESVFDRGTKHVLNNVQGNILQCRCYLIADHFTRGLVGDRRPVTHYYIIKQVLYKQIYRIYIQIA